GVVIFWSKCSRFVSVFGSDMLHCYICYTCYTLPFQLYSRAVSSLGFSFSFEPCLRTERVDHLGSLLADGDQAGSRQVLQGLFDGRGLGFPGAVGTILLQLPHGDLLACGQTAQMLQQRLFQARPFVLCAI